ncbi:MAG: ABC transporter substrate-binding protein [Spirochaetales bacterium]|nr:ABC transporter substrate-binding protein [Spirochaetales bacterium]
MSSPFLGAESPNDPPDTRIVVFTPTTENNTYWPQVYSILESAGKDLGIEILGFEFEVEDRFAKFAEGVDILRNTPDIDGAIFSVAFGQTEPLLKATEELKIPVFIQGPLFESELPDLGWKPRRKYRYWIGLFSQNEYEKGYTLGNILLESAIEREMFSSGGLVHVAGIGGDPTWHGSQRRAAGLEQAVEVEPQSRLLQIVPTFWSEQEGERIATSLLERYPQTSVIWAASDQLAIGAVKAVKKKELVPGKDILIGGLDLSSRGLERVEQGSLHATVSGSLLSYAQILVYLYDYIYGRDFAPQNGTVIELTTYAATQDNARTHRVLYQSYRTIDFSTFSKVYNNQLDTYDFSLDSLREAVK